MIRSLTHPLVKKMVRLFSSSKERKLEKQCLVMGKKLIFDLAKELPIEHLLIKEPLSLKAKETTLVTEEILKKISHEPSPPDAIALFSLPQAKNLKNKKRLIFLDRIQDPGNVGTLLRSALAFGFEGAILSSMTADPFQPKAIASSRGASLLLPLEFLSTEEFLARDYPILVADLEGALLEEVTSPSTLILSHEGSGPDPLFAKEKRISIPISSKMESLNVAAAGAILMYHFRNVS